jgi:hypothetical protein
MSGLPDPQSTRFIALPAKAIPMLKDKLAALIDTFSLPRKNIVPTKLAFQIAEFAALLEEAPDVDVSTFEALPIELRKACLALFIANVAGRFE